MDNFGKSNGDQKPANIFLAPGLEVQGDSDLYLVVGHRVLSAALLEIDLPIVSLQGIWSWAADYGTPQPDGRIKLIPELAAFNLRRDIYQFFPGEGHTDARVRLAAFSLARELCHRGASVGVSFLQSLTDAEEMLLAFFEALGRSWPYDPTWSPQEAEIWWHLRKLEKSTPKPELLKQLSPVAFQISKMKELEAEAVIAELGSKFDLKESHVKALKRAMKETQKRTFSSPTPPRPTLSPQDELQFLHAQAAALEDTPNLLEKILNILRHLGLAGQETGAQILYLALTTRIFERPVSVVVKGPSSSGKSYLVEKVLELFPTSAYYDLTAMSEKALAYSQEPLSHRHLVIFELHGQGGEFSQYVLRSLISEGRLRYEFTDFEQKTAMLVKKEGPTGLIITTTQEKLHPENETRMLSLEVDDSPEQTRAVLMAQARGGQSREINLESFRAFQRIFELEKPKVIIPYAESVAEGCEATVLRLRRDFTVVLSLVKAHALLHARYRERDDQGRVVANLQDYARVFELVEESISQGADYAVSEAIRETVTAVAELLEKDAKKEPVNISQIAHHLDIDKSNASRRVKVAIEKGYLTNLQSYRNLPARIILGESLPEARSVLPKPELVEALLHPETAATAQPAPPNPRRMRQGGLYEPAQPDCNRPETSVQADTGGVAGCAPVASPPATTKPASLLTPEGSVARLRDFSGGMGINESHAPSDSPGDEAGGSLAECLAKGEEIDL